MLTAAYEAAVHANATTRQAIAHAQAAAAAAKRRDEEAARVAKAKAAGASLTGSPSSTTAAPPRFASVEDAIRAAMADAGYNP